MKILISILIFIISLGSIYAQKNKDDKPSKITFIGGWNYSKYVGGEDQVSKTDYKSVLILGVSKDVKISPFIWSNGGILYYQNGASTEEGDYKFDYLMIPVGLKLRFGPLYAMGGLYGAYRMSATFDSEKLNKNDFNRLDFGTYVGAGTKILIFSLNVKYNWGFSDVSNGSSNSENYDLRNQFLSITLGVGIP